MTHYILQILAMIPVLYISSYPFLFAEEDASRSNPYRALYSLIEWTKIIRSQSGDDKVTDFYHVLGALGIIALTIASPKTWQRVFSTRPLHLLGDLSYSVQHSSK